MFVYTYMCYCYIMKKRNIINYIAAKHMQSDTLQKYYSQTLLYAFATSKVFSTHNSCY